MNFNSSYFKNWSEKKILWTASSCLAALLGAGILISYLSNSTGHLTSEENSKTIPVATTTAEIKDLSSTFQTQTYLLPWKEVTLKPPASTSVRKIHVHVGDSVKSGDLLASLDSEIQSLKSELDHIELEMKNIEMGVTRALAKNSFLSKNEFKQKELEHRASKIRSRLSSLDNSSTMKSPIDGTVAEIMLKEGDYIDQAGTTPYWIKVVDDSKLRVQVYLPSDVATKISDKSQVYFQIPGEKKTAVAGSILALSPTVDPKSGTVFSEAALSANPEKWRPGQFVDVAFVIAAKEQVVSVPKESVTFENSQTYVYVIVDSRAPASADETLVSLAKKTPVKLGLEQGSDIEIIEGLEAMDQIVIQGQGALTDGAKVEILQ